MLDQLGLAILFTENPRVRGSIPRLATKQPICYMPHSDPTTISLRQTQLCSLCSLGHGDAPCAVSTSMRQRDLSGNGRPALASTILPIAILPISLAVSVS
jgi:hypothetical protein